MKQSVMHLTLHVPPGFDFWRTAYSHGWCDLPPFNFSIEKRQLTRLLVLDGGVLAHCCMTGGGKAVQVEVRSSDRLSSRQRALLLNHIGTCLRLDEDFSHFHREARRYPHYRWIVSTGSGRMLRSPTVFEDVVKMICTTNCTWALTKLVVTNLVNAFGSMFNDSTYSFPAARVLAGTTERTLRSDIRAGYRSPYLLELAERVASGKLDIEGWRTADVPTGELFKQMRAVKGVGPYAAGNLMKLVGRYDYLGLDSWVRAKFCELHKNGRTVKDATIERHYAGYGTWRGLFFWLEMTRSWHDQKFRF